MASRSAAERTSSPATSGEGGVLEVARTFLGLGLTAFGGPNAHLGYFQRELVERRRWIDPASYAELVALCQFLPGPASSQVGIALGAYRAGWGGAGGAGAGLFTLAAVFLPSFLLVLGVLHFWERLRASRSIQAALVGVNAAVVGLVVAALYDPPSGPPGSGAPPTSPSSSAPSAASSSSAGPPGWSWSWLAPPAACATSSEPGHKPGVRSFQSAGSGLDVALPRAERKRQDLTPSCGKT